MRLQRVVAHEFRLHAFLKQTAETGRQVLFAGTLPRRAGAGALFLHLFGKAFLVHGEAALVGHVGHNVEREAVGVVQAEGHVAGNHGLAGRGERFKFAVEQGEALVEGHAEAVFFLEHHAGNEVGVLAKFGIVVAHDFHHLAHGLVEECLVQTHERAEAQRAADETAQHVAAAFVGRQNAVGDHEGGGGGRR